MLRFITVLDLTDIKVDLRTEFNSTSNDAILKLDRAIKREPFLENTVFSDQKSIYCLFSFVHIYSKTTWYYGQKRLESRRASKKIVLVLR